MEEAKEHRLAAVLTAEIDRFGQMLEREEERAIEKHRQISAILRKCGETHRGKVLKSGANSWLMDFRTALDAVKCAAALQEETAVLQGGGGENAIALRIGVHLGDIYFYENDALGEGIAIAAKLREICKPGRICVSSDIYHQVFRKLSLPFKNMGQVKVPEVSHEIQAFEIIPEHSGDSAFTGGKTGTPDQAPPIDFEDIKTLIKDTMRYAGKRIEEELRAKSAPPQESPRREEPPWERHEYSDYYSHQSRHGRHRQTPPPPPFRGESWKEYRDRAREELKEIRREERRGRRRPASLPSYEHYRNRVEEDMIRARSGFRAHLIPFSAVSGFLVVLNILTGGHFPWSLIPIGAWGIGLFTHWATIREKERRRKDLERLPRLTSEQTGLIRRIHRIRQSFTGHLASTVSVSVFLAMLNFITSPSYPWFLFPAAALGLGLAIHWGGFSGNRKELNRRLQASIEAGPAAGSGAGAADYRESAGDLSDNPAVAEAWRLKQSILKKAEELGDTPLLEEMKTVLPDYIEQIRSLAGKEKEVKELLGSIPIPAMERDRETLKARLEETSDEGMKREYSRSIDELDKQLESFRSLNERRELLSLKVQSSVNSLRKLQADLIKIPDAKSKTPYSLDSLKKRADELGDYLSDLERGYRELDD